jgi:hypothetical protein
MERNLYRKLPAAAGVLLLSALAAGCAALGGGNAGAGKLATDAAQQIVHSGQLTFLGTSTAAVDGYELPQLPSFEGRLTGGKQLVVAVRPGPAAANGTAAATQATFTRESVGAWKATKETGSAAPLLPWNPLPWLEQLPQLMRQSSLDAKQSDGSTRVVRVELIPDEVKRLVTEQLQQERQRVQERLASAQTGKAGGSLSAAQAGAGGSALSAAAAQAFGQLDQMLSTLRAEGELTLWLDRTTSRPTKLSLKTNLHYYSGAEERSETASTDYTFGDEGSGGLLPS